MEENESGPLQQLLAKRQKLMNLRDTLTEKYRLNTERPTETHHSNPVTPHSNEQRSISPPPFSPLTPLISMRPINKNINLTQGSSNSDISNAKNVETKTPSSFSPIRPISPCSSSPLRPMSPETQQLFNVLSEHPNITEDINISPHEDVLCDFDSDDSVRDPNFIIRHDRNVNIDESSTSCSSLDNNEACTNNVTSMVEQHNNIEVTSTIDIPKPLINSNEHENNLGRPKKGRKRKFLQNRAERRHNKYNNLEYITTRNEVVKPKTFIDYRCNCLKKCPDLVPVEVRKEEFEKYVKLGSFNAQVLFIASSVTELTKKRSYTMVNVPADRKKPKQFHRVYKIREVQVCRDMFLKTFQITTQKVTVSLKKYRSGEPIADTRGSKSSNLIKLSDEDRKFIVDIIEKLPKYESHYRRNNNSGTLYLQPSMTLNKIYNIYTKEYTQIYGTERKCASFETMKKIFYANFNLKCKKLKKDTCNKCDLFSIKVSNAKTQQEKEEAEAEKLEHLGRAETLRNQMNQDFIDAKNNPDVECLTFDLEKTLPLPRIPTNVAFYKRQLWLYNSGIHSASNDIGHCYVWVEGEAGRGAQEVGSCLLKYIKTKLQPTVKHLILWSDCCGGQNRNIKIVLLLKTVLCSHPSLETITFRFLESGHTFLPNDTDFSKIETALKHHQRVYTAEEYIDIIKNAKKKNPLQVERMQKIDFVSTEKIEKNISNRKKFTDKSKVSWIYAKEIKIEKRHLYIIYMRPSFDDPFKELYIEKKNKEIKISDLKLLWPNGKPIAPAKLADLESMYMFIPENNLQFYRNLKSSDNVVDDFEGFGGDPDFELLED